jgi:hypothetical protein
MRVMLFGVKCSDCKHQAGFSSITLSELSVIKGISAKLKKHLAQLPYQNIVQWTLAVKF